VLALRETVTISQLAKLMKVSTHQIRYFEEKGILPPGQTDANGYRLYGIQEAYSLAHILLLRKLHIPVADIKDCLERSSPEDYKVLLHESAGQLAKQIQELEALRSFTLAQAARLEETSGTLGQFRTCLQEGRKLLEIYADKHDSNFTAKQWYDRMMELDHTIHLHETDLIRLYDESGVRMCLAAEGQEIDRRETDGHETNGHETDSLKTDTLLLPEGTYLCYEFLAGSDQEFEEQVQLFQDYAQEHRLQTAGPFIAIEHSMLSTFYKDKLYYEIQMALR
jgi:DNA-binding transcriptional MerR regulator